MSVRDDAVEAAAQAEYYALAGPVTWEELDESWRNHYRKKIRAHVLVTLGVVADHCTTQAEHETPPLHDGPNSELSYGRLIGWQDALRELAAELRETE